MFLLPPPQSLSNFKQLKHFNVFLYSFIHNRKPLANVLLHQYSCFSLFWAPTHYVLFLIFPDQQFRSHHEEPNARAAAADHRRVRGGHDQPDRPRQEVEL